MRHISKWQRLLCIPVAVSISTIACSELADWIACNVATNLPQHKSCVVLVLGYPSHRDGTPDRVQEMRVAAGVDAYRHARLIAAKLGRSAFSGGGTNRSINTATSDAVNVIKSIRYASDGLNCVVIIPAIAGPTIMPMLKRIELSAITADINSVGITF